MNYQIDRNSGESAYLQLYELLKRDIMLGIYSYSDKLPSKRTIAQDTGISIITAEHALELLCEEGYIEARQRSGYFVIFRDRDFTVSPGNEFEDAFKVRTNTFDANTGSSSGKTNTVNTRDNFGKFLSGASLSSSHGKADFPFSVLARTMRKVLLDYGENILIKSPNQGAEVLRREISSYLKRSRAIYVDPSQIVIGAGAEYLYGLIAQLLGRNRIYALEDPSYDKIEKVYRSLDITCDMLTMGNDGIISSELERTQATVLHITPFNSFPSGITAGISKKHEYLLWATKRQGYIIEDNYDSELTVSKKPEEPLFTLAGGSNVIYVNTFSQTIAPSIRVGYMILPKDMVDDFNDREGFYSCTVSLYEQYVLADLLRNGDYERHINRVRRNRRKEAKNESNLQS